MDSPFFFSVFHKNFIAVERTGAAVHQYSTPNNADIVYKLVRISEGMKAFEEVVIFHRMSEALFQKFWELFNINN
jgi:hypothetical protein